MNLLRTILFALTGVLFLYSCKEKEQQVQPADFICKTLPSFVRDVGFQASRSAFSTAERQTMGLVLKEFADTGSRIYQHPSWREAGWLSALQLDRSGNIFVAPAPFISVLNNPVSKQNILYIIKGVDQRMVPFIELPSNTDSSGRNPFGITGIAYNCRDNLLYVSSVAGSDLHTEKGCLYVIDAATATIIDKYEGRDFFGLEVGVAGEKPLLLAGSTRTSEVYSFEIDGKGKLSGSPQLAFDLTNMGPRGDDKARKIVFNNDGTITVSGLSFSYNLIASTERPETLYYFRYDEQLEKWVAI
jgi:hypothetical protein